MAKQVAQFLWIGDGLSPLEHVCLKSFLDVGYDAHLYTYGPMANVPEGVVMKDAGEIIPEDDQFFGPHTCDGRYANFSDRFRYALLYKRGGWWFDTDHIALRFLPEPTDLLVGSQWEGWEYPCGGAIWSTPGDYRVKWMLDRCEEIIRQPGERSYIALGPALVKEMVERFKPTVAPWYEFNPVQYYHLNRLIYRTHREWLVDVLRSVSQRFRQLRSSKYRAPGIRPGSRAIHLANEIWRVNGLDKSAWYHPRSIYGRLQRKHGFRV